MNQCKSFKKRFKMRIFLFNFKMIAKDWFKKKDSIRGV